MKFDFKHFALPILLGVGALAEALVSAEREDKIDDLMKRIDKLESKEEES